MASELRRHVPDAGAEAVALLDPARGAIEAPIRSEIFGAARFATSACKNERSMSILPENGCSTTFTLSSPRSKKFTTVYPAAISVTCRY
jgi:hypothetical protein